MKLSFWKIGLVGFIITFTLLSFTDKRYILYFLLEDNLEKLSKDLRRNSFSEIVIANTKGDGSEMIPNEFPKDIKDNLNTIFWITKLFCGLESRIYLDFDYDSDKLKYERICKRNSSSTQDMADFSVIELSTTKMWRNSTFYFGDIELTFIENEEVIDAILTNDNNYKRIIGGIIYHENTP